MNIQANPLDGLNLVENYDQLLASYAQKNKQSFGRIHPENEDPDRLPFQRDRDRVIHSRAFRRLKGKMQVVAPQKGDHYRNRLTHTLEVSQISRDIARNLKLNEDLCETIALAHDLGHTPFGHAGETALNQKMKGFGKTFEHNLQSLRIVENLENRYSDFPGLNLSYEVLTGLQKHTKGFILPDKTTVNWQSLEAQLVDICDEMAYISADLEDAFRGEYITWKDLEENELCTQVIQQISKSENGFNFTQPNLSPSKLNHQLLHVLIQTLIQDSQKNIKNFPPLTPKTPKRNSNIPYLQSENRLIEFNQENEKKFLDLKTFLYKNFYELPEIQSHTNQGQKVISNIFDHLLLNPDKIPTDFQTNEPLENRICDYIAGMTDQFATQFL